MTDDGTRHCGPAVIEAMADGSRYEELLYE
jgi:hypothetical protein